MRKNEMKNSYWGFKKIKYEPFEIIIQHKRVDRNLESMVAELLDLIDKKINKDEFVCLMHIDILIDRIRDYFDLKI